MSKNIKQHEDINLHISKRTGVPLLFILGAVAICYLAQQNWDYLPEGITIETGSTAGILILLIKCIVVTLALIFLELLISIITNRIRNAVDCLLFGLLFSLLLGLLSGLLSGLLFGLLFSLLLGLLSGLLSGLLLGLLYGLLVEEDITKKMR